MKARDRVLELLEMSRGEYVSGELVAQRLAVSRNTVWRAVKELQDAGYAIRAGTNRGYCLEPDNDILSPAGIAPHLLSGEAARRIEVFGEVQSTNQLAKERAAREVVHGQTILADSQRTGRGRHGRAFFSPAGSGIYISFVLDPDRLGFETPRLATVWAAVCVCRILEELCGLRPGIKWVNDILLDGKKVAGILTEAISDFESGRVSAIVLGIGINVKTREFPASLAGTAGSLYPGGKAAVPRNRLAAELVNRICLGDPVNGNELLGEYKQRLTVLGKDIRVVEGEGGYTAKALDIAENGGLIMELPDHSRRTLQSGEIRVML